MQLNKGKLHMKNLRVLRFLEYHHNRNVIGVSSGKVALVRTWSRGGTGETGTSGYGWGLPVEQSLRARACPCLLPPCLPSASSGCIN